MEWLERTRVENHGSLAYFYDNQYVTTALPLDREPFSTYIVQRLALTPQEC
jgi:hypothetical protein